MPSLKRNKFSDDAISDSLSNRCGWLLDCLSSREIHVVTLSIFRWTNNGVSAVYLMFVASFCSSHAFDDT